MLLILLFLFGLGAALGSRRLPGWLGLGLFGLVGLLLARLSVSLGAMLPTAALLLLAAAPLSGVAIGRLAAPRRQRAIPRAELAALGTTIARADTLAAEGRVDQGYHCLVAGLQRAEEARAAGSPWARDLVGRWQGVVEEYAREYALAPSSELVPAAAPDARGDEAAPA